jgi:hypothetical protein
MKAFIPKREGVEPKICVIWPLGPYYPDNRNIKAGGWQGGNGPFLRSLVLDYIDFSENLGRFDSVSS